MASRSAGLSVENANIALDRILPSVHIKGQSEIDAELAALVAEEQVKV